MKGCAIAFQRLFQEKRGNEKGKETLNFASQVASSKMGPEKVDEHVNEALDFTGSMAKFVAHDFTDPAVVGKHMELVATLSVRCFNGELR